MLFCVHSSLLWNSSQIVLKANTSYSIRPAQGAIWYDSYIASGPDGYSNWYVDLFQRFLRVPVIDGKKCRFFELIGTFGKDETNAFSIGEGLVVAAPQECVLYAFANDLRSFYFNNRGSILVNVDET